MKNLSIRSEIDTLEIAWFDDLCNGDYEYLGVSDGKLRSSFEHCSEIIKLADELKYNNILLPSSYQVGQDVVSFASAAAMITKQISMLTAIRCGEMHPPMLARTMSTLDHILKGRLTINIISSDLPGTKEESSIRYQKSKEVIQILKKAWTDDRIIHKGKFYEFDLDSDPSKSYQINGGPLLYFGGISPEARELCAEFCDVFLLWPETKENLFETMQDLSKRAEKYNRKIDFGLRIHLIIRDTEKESKEAAKKLISKLNSNKADEIKNRSLDAKSYGVQRQDELRKNADSDGFIEPLIWSGIGQARSGCGSAIVGTPEQILDKIEDYKRMGFRAFIFSGYPLLEECKIFGEKVLPKINTKKLAEVQERIPKNKPITPLTNGERK
jgi:alkanesulfonate monooxygenase